jgi:ABC-type multidrug transport system ATPase subunit
MEILIEGLSKVYGKVYALKNINMFIGNGMFGLLGPNGAGKTTLMRIMATIQEPSTGTVRMGHYDVTEQPGKVRSIIGYLPQDFGIYRNLNPVEFLDYVAVLKGMKDKKKRLNEVEDVLYKVNLYSERKNRISGFSGGMRQRMGIAQALLGNPPVLILDEPTAGLDPEERTRFRNILTDLSRDRIVVSSTHVLADIESSCNMMAVLKKGEIIYSGRVEGLIEGIMDKVYEMEMDFDRYDAFDRRHLIISTKRTRDGFKVRFISDKEVPGAVRAECCLEDGYIYSMGGYEHAEDNGTC